MFLLTILDDQARAHARRIDGPTCLDAPDGARGRWLCFPDGDAVTLRDDSLRALLTLRPGERAELDGHVVCLTRDRTLGPERVVPASRRAPLALRLPGRRPVRLADRAATLGSSLACDLVVDDPAVSPRHCEITPRDGRFVAWDLGSANGLWVGGARVPWAVLDAGARITVGRTELECVPLDERPDDAGSIVGASRAIEGVRREIERVGRAPYAVLVEGESGVGKELVAREIHRASPRARGPMVSVNCGAIAPELVESELFGHERGAFTGAQGRRRGLFEEAHGGTLFLDEIGELPLALQPKLLRVLETGELRRVGADATVRVDVRVVSATLRDLEQRVADGAFRHDLFFRLQDFRVRVPPLRERPEDIPALCDALLDRIARETGRYRRLEDRALARLMSWHWPGNVRELFATLKRATFATSSPLLGVEHLGFEPLGYASRGGDGGVRDAPLAAWPEAVAPGDLRALHAWCGGNLTRMSRITGLARSTVRARLARAAG